MPALREISFTIEEGEYIALVGANGSGKTSLARMLNATLLPNQGWVKVAGLDTRIDSNHAQIRARVGMVFQYPQEQMIGSTVSEDVSFGVEQMGLSTEECAERVESALRKVGMWNLRERAISMLSAGQIQRVAIGGILAIKPRVIIFDETTSMLDPSSRKLVISFMRELHQEGITQIIITHYMEETLETQRIIALHEGHIVIDAAPRIAFSQTDMLQNIKLNLPFASRMAIHCRSLIPHFKRDILFMDELVDEIHRKIPNNYLTPYKNALGVSAPIKEAKPMIRVEHLDYIYHAHTQMAQTALEDITFDVAEGSAYGLIGGTGSGKSTLLQHIIALLRAQKGSVEAAGLVVSNPNTDVKVLRRMVGFAFQTPEDYFFEQYVGDEIAYKAKMYGIVDKKILKAKVSRAMAMVGLDFDTYKDRMTFALSGGERRKVALASVFMLEPKIILLDEPTAGLDPFAREELLKQLKISLDEGSTILFASHLMEDMIFLASHCSALKDGKQGLSGEVKKVLSDVEGLQGVGLSPPMVNDVVRQLNQKGWQIPIDMVSEDDLMLYLKQTITQSKA